MVVVASFFVVVASFFVVVTVVVMVVATLLVRRATHSLRLKAKLVDPELNFVVEVRVVGGSTKDRAHVQRVGNHGLFIDDGGADTRSLLPEREAHLAPLVLLTGSDLT
ncbi:hypothetical protein GN958_ATG00920 [Phytophthora infestans]|uniref:Uncharacterized protein n=1 Tax=Phytophthora infestans TaxID=4787 RepID=A0A8S9VAV2_PHYIN|nr:hypothetical protein GN958_ATG00920 [Phytophthora infestans]